MTLHPGSTFFWYLDSTALIMSQDINLEAHLLRPAVIEKHMITNAPVVPPDSVIKTFSNLKGDRIDLVVTQDKEGLAPSSFVVRNGEWAKYFLDAWFDPIYRSYNFQKAESHALEHIVQYVSLRAPAMLLDKNTPANTTQMARHDSGQASHGPAIPAQRIRLGSERAGREVQGGRPRRQLPRVRQRRARLRQGTAAVVRDTGEEETGVQLSGRLITAQMGLV